MMSQPDVQRNPGAEERSPVSRRPIIPNAGPLRASVGSTEALDGRLARFGRIDVGSTEASLGEEILNRHRSSWLDARIKVDLGIVPRLGPSPEEGQELLTGTSPAGGPTSPVPAVQPAAIVVEGRPAPSPLLDERPDSGRGARVSRAGQ